ncbi:hypothetical protein CEQ90_03175 [Lewinellaceae bacterium SD302]|nr:hypothetical protein CEQ90_03175 [Lewinellaceae bacterium SD302]
MNIRFIPQEEIDRQLYNSCVHFATNGSIYGYDWWLNNTARDWDLLVEGDKYVSALPLPKTKNWLGRLQLEQPRLVPELALYSVKPLSKKRVASFWEAVPAEFKRGSLTLEPWSIPDEKTRFQLTEATGSVLDLSRPYEEVTDNFDPAWFNELAKAELADLMPTGNLKPERIAALYRDFHGAGTETDWHFHAMQRLMYQTLHRGWGGPWGIQTREGEVLAAVFLIYSHGRLFPLAKTVTEVGKKTGAEAKLWDNILHAHCGRPLRIKREEIPYIGETEKN